MSGLLPPSWSLRWSANLAVLWGTMGVVLGVLGAVTFVPYRAVDSLSTNLAIGLSIISGAGALLSGFGTLAGWRLRHLQSHAWAYTMLSAFASVGSVVAMGVVWPPFGAFIGVVVLLYGIEVVLLLAGWGDYRRAGQRPRSA
jgi:hypothetical protein